MPPLLTDAAPSGNGDIPRHQHKMGRPAAGFRGVFRYAVSISVPAAVNFLVFLITLRVLSPEDFGVVALALTVSMLAVSLGPGGFGETLVQRESLRADHLATVFWACMSFAAPATRSRSCSARTRSRGRRRGHDEKLAIR